MKHINLHFFSKCEFKAKKIDFLLFVFTVFLAISSYSEDLITNSWPENLVIHISNQDFDLEKSRIISALEAVGSDGRLIIDLAIGSSEIVNKTQIEKFIDNLKPKEKNKILLSKSTESSPWIRDTAIGWKNGELNQLIGPSAGNLTGKFYSHSFAMLSISTLLTSCQKSKLKPPELYPYILQGGLLVNNQSGICVITPELKNKIIESNDDLTKIMNSLGCNKILDAPSTIQWQNQGHLNGHADLSIAFISNKHALIPSVSQNCQTKFITGWPDLKKQLVENGIKVNELPIALGCIDYRSSSYFTDNSINSVSDFLLDGKSDQFAKDYITQYTPMVRSYSNLVVLKNTILIPRYLAPNQYKNISNCSGKKNGYLGCAIPAKIELQDYYDIYNNQAVEEFKTFIAKGSISQTKVVQFPISEEDVINGGSVRCMTYEVPGNLSNCTQENLNEHFNLNLDQARNILALLPMSHDEHLCLQALELQRTLNFMSGPAFEGRNLEDLSTHKKILLTDNIKTDAKSFALKIEGAIQSFCKFKN